MLWEGAPHWDTRAVGPPLPLCLEAPQHLSLTWPPQPKLSPLLSRSAQTLAVCPCSLARPQATGGVGFGLTPSFARGGLVGRCVFLPTWPGRAPLWQRSCCPQRTEHGHQTLNAPHLCPARQTTTGVL